MEIDIQYSCDSVLYEFKWKQNYHIKQKTCACLRTAHSHMNGDVYQLEQHNGEQCGPVSKAAVAAVAFEQCSGLQLSTTQQRRRARVAHVTVCKKVKTVAQSHH